jgi:hypothetical protein
MKSNSKMYCSHDLKILSRPKIFNTSGDLTRINEISDLLNTSCSSTSLRSIFNKRESSKGFEYSAALSTYLVRRIAKNCNEVNYSINYEEP